MTSSMSEFHVFDAAMVNGSDVMVWRRILKLVFQFRQGECDVVACSCGPQLLVMLVM